MFRTFHTEFIWIWIRIIPFIPNLCYRQVIEDIEKLWSITGHFRISLNSQGDNLHQNIHYMHHLAKKLKCGFFQAISCGVNIITVVMSYISILRTISELPVNPWCTLSQTLYCMLKIFHKHRFPGWQHWAGWEFYFNITSIPIRLTKYDRIHKTKKNINLISRMELKFDIVQMFWKCIPTISKCSHELTLLLIHSRKTCIYKIGLDVPI